MEFSESEVRSYFGIRAPKLKQNGRQLRGPCPVHSGKDDNFSVELSSGMSFCHSRCGQGWDMISLEESLMGRKFADAKDSVFEIVGRPKVPWEERDFIATYDYHDQNGKLVYQVVRKKPTSDSEKPFGQRRPDDGGGWSWGLGSVERVPFQLPKVVAAKAVCITEGEKDALTLTRLGMTATCNNGGAGNFKPELVKWFAGKRIAVFFDNDDVGRSHALKVAGMLKPVAESVRIVELPGLPLKGDVTDFVRSGATLEVIRERCKAAKEWTEEWEFTADAPDENEKYVRTVAQIVEMAGGLDKFWQAGRYEGISTPWRLLNDAMAGGMRKGEVYVIGANSGAGKTSLALQFVRHALRKKHYPLYFSMEMIWDTLIQRMASIDARVDLLEFWRLQRYDRSHVEDVEYKEAVRALGFATSELMNSRLLVSTKPSVHPKYLLAETERIRKREPIDLIVIDHMQLMSASEKVNGDYEKFTAISRATKQMAVEAMVPVILISQTSRSNSKDKRTELEVSDLRGSGAIEEDACSVFLLYPDAEDKAAAKAEGMRFAKGPIKSWLKIGKNRFGWQDGTIEMVHHKKYTRFDLAGQEELSQ